MKRNLDVAKGTGLSAGVLLALPGLHLAAGGAPGAVHAGAAIGAFVLLAVCGAALAGKES
jgi:hypothetical protein